MYKLTNIVVEFATGPMNMNLDRMPVGTIVRVTVTDENNGCQVWLGNVEGEADKSWRYWPADNGWWACREDAVIDAVQRVDALASLYAKESAR